MKIEKRKPWRHNFEKTLISYGGLAFTMSDKTTTSNSTYIHLDTSLFVGEEENRVREETELKRMESPTVRGCTAQHQRGDSARN